MGRCFGKWLCPIQFTHTYPIARFLFFYKLGWDFGHILFVERRATEVGFDVCYLQDTSIAVIGVAGDIVFRNGGQRVQWNAEGLDAFDISHLLGREPYRLASQSAKLQGIGNGGVEGQLSLRASNSS